MESPISIANQLLNAVTALQESTEYRLAASSRVAAEKVNDLIGKVRTLEQKLEEFESTTLSVE